MRKDLLVGAALLMGALLMNPAASAAQVRQISFGVGGGVSLPQGELADEAGMGFHGQVSLGLGMFPVRVRADGYLQRFTEEDDGGWMRALGGMANFFLPLGGDPYIVAGLGMLHVSDEHEHEEPATNFAFAFGGGLNFNLIGRGAFIEAKYLDAGEHHRSIPITLGINLF